MADDYLLFFFPFAFNFDFFHFFLTFLQWYCHLNLQVDSDLAIKKSPQKSRLEFLRAYAISLKSSVQLVLLIHCMIIYT